jgi:diguanylate cyclase (GGDEF)-like protein/PAS domain S-box-containing protein
MGGVQTRVLPPELPAVVLDVLPVPALITDAAGIVVYANPAFTAATGYSSSEALGRPAALLDGPGADPTTADALRECVAAARQFVGTVRRYRRTGEEFWVSLTIRPVRDDGGTVTHYVVLQRDVTHQIEAQRTRRDTEQQRATSRVLLDLARSLAQHTSTAALLQAVARAIPELCGADRSGVAEWDPVANRISMLAVAGWHGALLDDALAYIASPRESPELDRLVTRHELVLINRGNASEWARATLEHFGVNTILTVPMSTGRRLPGLLIASWVRSTGPERIDADLDARLSGLAGVAAIALDNAHLLEQVRQAATRDPLTGLPNRSVLEHRLAHALQQRADGAQVGLIYCDIDRFKHTNDALGHPAGDRVLQEVAARLSGALRDGDTVARVGGDEFIVVLPRVRHRDEVDAVVRRLDDALEEPITIDGSSLRVRLSAGIAISEPGDHAPVQAVSEALIRAADAAMYWRKSRRSLPFALDPLPPEQRLRAELPGAVARGEIRAYYQPQLDLRTGEIVAVEALARWAHPELGLLTAEEFIPLAESTGDIAVLGRHMLRTSCRLVADLRRRHPTMAMSVNVSAHELASPRFTDHVRAELAGADLPPAALTLELTETRLPPDEALLCEQSNQLRHLGVNISLDDFGMGYTAIAQLQRLPISELKIDRYFIQQQPTPGADLAAAIVDLAHTLHLQVVGEGIETPQQLAHLRRIGADRAQGYLLSPPLTGPELRRYLATAADGLPPSVA